MSRRDHRIYREAAALWRELYGKPPPRGADGRAMLELITRQLPTKNYARLNSPFVRPSTVTFPKSRGDSS